MKLTHDYRKILAFLDRPLPFEKVNESLNNRRLLVEYEFSVGPLNYLVVFRGDLGRVDVGFDLHDMSGTDEELMEYFSKVFQRTFTWEDFFALESRMKGEQGADLGVGNSTAVFATVMAIIMDFIGHYPQVECLTLKGETAQKTRIYRKMLQGLLNNGWRLTQQSGVRLTLCKVSGGTS